MPKVRRAGRMRLVALASCCAGLAIGAVGVGLGAGAAAPAPAPQAQPALDWLAGQLAANGGSLPPSFGAGTDWGLTADAVLAFTSAGRATDPAAVTATDLLTANAAAFTTWSSGGATVRDAGATGKLVLALRSMGRPATAQGVDLEAELRSLMETSGAQAGRFSDDVPDPAWNASNGFGQSLSMLGLALTPGGIPAPSVTFLLAQQCPAGGFRLNYLATAGCTDDAQADTDATALALSALLAVSPRSTDVATALDRGTSWVLARQAADGSFTGTGPTAGANANSTGLISQYLRAAGRTQAADLGAAWIVGCCQLTTANASGTPAAGQVGAIGYGPTALSAALVDGVTTQTGDQWRRTTSQAVLALGLAPYGPVDVAPLAPSPTTTSTGPTGTSTTVTSTTVTSTTTDPTSTTSTTTPTTSSSIPASTTTASVQGQQLVDSGIDIDGGSYSAGGTSGGSSSGSGSALAITGGDPAPLLTAAILLLALGAVLSTTTERRGRP